MAQRSIADLLYDSPVGTLTGEEVVPLDVPTTETPSSSSDYQSEGSTLSTILTWIINNIPGASGAVAGLMSAAQYTTVSNLKTVATSGSYNDLLNRPSLAAVATSGSYGDLTGIPTIGTAAAHADSDFATAAQGVLAASAVQSSQLGAASGVATLDSNQKLASSQIPTSLTGLGTAAYTNSSAYATAAQGSLASSALQPDASSQILATNSRRKVTVSGNVTGAVTIDLSLGGFITATLTGDVTFSFSNLPPSGYMAEVILYLSQDATGSRTVTWPTSGKWPSATPFVLSTAASAMDIVKMYVDSAGNWVGEGVANVG